MRHTTSADGTAIAYEHSGSGPALVFVVGAFNDRHSFGALADLLAKDFTVHTYDRRGRGDSSDTAPYAVQREVEDLAAVIDAAGGSAGVFGHSSGAILGLEAALAGLPITRLAVYGPPYIVGTDRARPTGLADEVAEALAATRPGDAAAAFMAQAVEMPAEAIAGMRRSPAWPALEAMAPTLPYDLAVCGDQQVPERLAAIAVPTLALTGEDSPVWARNSVAAVAAIIPGGRSRTVAGSHQISEVALVPVLTEFLLAADQVATS
jgi:pimeloyl-ACP methyl ester carboxylesterase